MTEPTGTMHTRPTSVEEEATRPCDLVGDGPCDGRPAFKAALDSGGLFDGPLFVCGQHTLSEVWVALEDRRA